MTDPTAAHDLRSVPLHLGVGSRAVPVPDWGWSQEQLAAYEERYAADGREGRLVMMFEQADSWDSWERHPAGDEVVVLVSGRADLLQELDGCVQRIPMAPGEAVINPAGVWHTAEVSEPGTVLTITPGQGTEHRPR
jgi:mannose-6-phosphate isomerase-like protein (cupin superfamily)